MRWKAADALAKTGSHEAVLSLIAALQDDNREVRHSAADALGEINDKQSLNPLIHALQDDSWQVRRCSLNSLGKIHFVPSKVLLNALKDEDPHVREKAVQIIARTKDERFIPTIKPLLKDEDQDVRETVTNTLKTLKTKKAKAKTMQKHDKISKHAKTYRRGY